MQQIRLTKKHNRRAKEKEKSALTKIKGKQNNLKYILNMQMPVNDHLCKHFYMNVCDNTKAH